MPRRSAVRIVGVLLVVAIGITALIGAVQRPPPAPASGFAQPTQPLPPPPGEAHFRELAARFSEFAGYWYDEQQNLVFGTTSTPLTPGLRNAADSVWRAHEKYFRDQPRGAVVFRTAEYTFTELALWRDALRDVVVGLEGAYFLDLDEVENAIVVGVDGGQVSQLQRLLDDAAENLNIPTAALRVVVSTPLERGELRLPEATAPLTATHTLRSHQRPIQGGYQIAYANSFCTLGWITWDIGLDPVFLTASHCSLDEGVVDSTGYSQEDTGVNNLVGVEVAEAYAYSCSGGPCHYGDVNVVKIYSSLTTYDANLVGRANLRKG